MNNLQQVFKIHSVIFMRSLDTWNFPILFNAILTRMFVYSLSGSLINSFELPRFLYWPLSSYFRYDMVKLREFLVRVYSWENKSDATLSYDWSRSTLFLIYLGIFLLPLLTEILLTANAMSQSGNYRFPSYADPMGTLKGSPQQQMVNGQPSVTQHTQNGGQHSSFNSAGKLKYQKSTFHTFTE